MKKLLSIVLASILVMSILGACSKREDTAKATDSGSKKKVLVMGTSADYKPYEYIDSAKSDEIIGFDADIAKYIGKELGYDIQIKSSDFSGLLASMEAKKVDFVMAGMTPTEERKKNADFTDIYFAAKNLVISKAGSYTDLNSLKGKKVGVQTGSIQEGKAKDLQKKVDFTIEGRDNVPQLFEELKIGRVDVIIVEDTVAKGYLKKFPELKTNNISEASDEAGSAIAFPKGSKLTSDFNGVLKKMKENGEMDKLIKKWFDSAQ
ncbi:transporter substrate-binding domain-containing protein [Ectobacillus ponti]|uniref:Transporter substrate-binding domain-containing protein n=1 Tax=Ectobacillus ponti TaxID=2961894 RepID=A0AA42BR39_9BACI|nr:transporter substrate-binding domain-containing protein [Ectobacillus ponti]MCP8967018.1 transporter substrate-binding domain-containing protein [Ectobacillus ponti]